MVLASLLMLPLFVAVGLAVDVGSWYLRASRIQQAADAAVLAGVVYQPDFDHAEQVARSVARANGFDPTTDPDVTVDVADAGNERLSVTIRDESVDLFFTTSALDSLSIQRTSTAEYLKPIPLGAPSNIFGNRDTDDEDDGDPQFWAAINGPYSPYEQGDPYTTRCLTVVTPFTGTSCSAANVEYRDGGYFYAVDIEADQVGNSIALWVFDPGLHPRAALTDETGDFSFVGPGLAPYPTTTFTVRDQDGTPLDYTDNPAIGGCSLSLPGNTAPAYESNWVKVCDFVPTFSGIYPLSVESTGQGVSMNGYSVAATLTGCGVTSVCDNPRVYGIGDMSIFINSTGESDFFLGEIDGSRAGDSFLIRAFDAGDGSGAGTYTLTLIPPPSLTITGCNYTGVNQIGSVVVPTATAPGCAIVTRNAGVSIFNGLWLEIEVDIPQSFTCDPSAPAFDDCWWRMEYDVPGSPQDRVTFEVFSADDPVHLVTNALP